MSEQEAGIEHDNKDIQHEIIQKLQAHFLGKELRGHGKYTPEDDCINVQAALKEAPREALARLKESQLWKRCEYLYERVFEAKEVEQIVKVNNALNAQPELVSQIVEALYSFQDERMKELGVNDTTRQIALDHLRQVSDLTAHPSQGNVDQLTRIIAAVHDISKYSAVETEDGIRPVFLLGMHEAASATIAGDVVYQALVTEKVAEKLKPHITNYEAAIITVRDFVGVAVAGHGKEEYPDKISARPAISEDGRVRLFWKNKQGEYEQLYIEMHRSATKYTTEDTSAVNKAALTRMAEGLREADMMSGISTLSFKKYHQDAPVEYVFQFPTSDRYIVSYSKTFREYMRDAPRELGLRETQEEQIDQNYLMFGLLQLVNEPSENVDEVIRELGVDLGNEKMYDLLDHVIKMKLVFDAVKDRKVQPKVGMYFHLQSFKDLVGSIDQISPRQLSQPAVQKFLKDSKKRLTQ